MSYGILRVQKVKAAAVHAMQYHNDRLPGEHSNKDIDPSRTPLNREWVAHGRYEDEVSGRIAAGRTSTRKVRKDAVVLGEGVMTASPEFFDGASDADVRAWAEDCFRFAQERFGAGNLVHFTLHMDEKTPHIHFGFVPLKDGALSWKKLIGGRVDLVRMQDLYHERVGKRWGLERGERGSGARHRDPSDLKRENEREIRAQEAQIAELDARIQEKTDRLESVQGGLEAAGEEVERLLDECRADARAAGGSGGLDRELGEARRAARGAEALDRECRAAVDPLGQIKGKGLPPVSVSRAGEQEARAGAARERAARDASRGRVRGLRGRLAAAVRRVGDFAWHLISTALGRSVLHTELGPEPSIDERAAENRAASRDLYAPAPARDLGGECR